jgi:hypothetical protein
VGVFFIVVSKHDPELVPVPVPEPGEVPALPACERGTVLLRNNSRTRNRVAHHNGRHGVAVLTNGPDPLGPVFQASDGRTSSHVGVMVGLERRRITEQDTRRGRVFNVTRILRVPGRLRDDLSDGLTRRISLAGPGLDVNELGAGHETVSV